MKEIINALSNILSKFIGFKLTPSFYVVLLVSITIVAGVDYLINCEDDWRLRIFIFGFITLATFITYRFFYQTKDKFASKRRVKKAVNKLSLEDCNYVLRCYSQDEYFTFDVGGEKIEFNIKWGDILYVPTGSRIFLHKPYKICVYEYAYELVKKRMHRELK